MLATTGALLGAGAVLAVALEAPGVAFALGGASAWLIAHAA